MMKKPFVIHPFLFAVFPVLFLYSHNVEQVSFSKTLLPSAISLGLTILLVLSLALILRNSRKAGVIVSVFLILFFSHGRIYEIVQSWDIGRWDRHKDLIRAWAILLPCSSYFIVRTRKDLCNFTNILNVMASCLIVISFINAAAYEFNIKGTWQDNHVRMKDVENNTTALGNTTRLRDIYYIILDGYANSSTVKELCNYDNHEFNDYLTKKGFYVAFRSRCNYPCTYLSLASSLNMKYINYLQDYVGRQSRDVAIPIQMIKDNEVVRLLKAKGYKYIHFASTWDPTKSNDYADLNIGHNKNFTSLIAGSEFMEMLIETTMLSAIPRTRDSVARSRREQILSTFSNLAEAQKIEGPKFIFAHIMLPHPPYVFDRNGEQVTRTESTAQNWKPEWQYLDQLIYTNKKISVLVDSILSRSEILPIIILQADHGPAFSGNSFSRRMIHERMRIFNAYYLPDINEGLLYDSITPVNTFRLVFKYYFGEDYELLEDTVYFTDTDKSFFDFVDITDQVHDYYR